MTLFRSSLAAGRGNIGSLLMQTSRAGEALEEFSGEEKILSRLAEEHPSIPDYRDELAGGQTNHATALLRLGRPSEARLLCDRAVELRERLVKDHPEILTYRVNLGASLIRSGLAHRDLGDVVGAAAALLKADTLLEAAGELDPDLTFLHGCCHAALFWTAGRPGSLLRADQAGAEATRALSLLRSAADMGYSDPAAFRNETALWPLLKRDDFRSLMMDLAMPRQGRFAMISGVNRSGYFSPAVLVQNETDQGRCRSGRVCRPRSLVARSARMPPCRPRPP